MINRMLQARSEVKAKAADEWLKDNVGDTRVVATDVRLAERRARVWDPERRVDRATLAVFVVLFLPVTLVSSVTTDNWFLASAVGLITVGRMPELVGGLLYDSSGDNARCDGER